MSIFTLTFFELPLELQEHILQYLPRGSVASFSRTCKRNHDCVNPYLYADIDISCHRSTQYSKATYQVFPKHYTYPWSSTPDCPLTFVRRQRHALDDEAYERQKLFTRSLCNNLVLGKHVRSLTWTFLNASHEVGSAVHGSRTAHGRHFHAGANDTPTWKAFEAMHSVKSIDIYWLRSYRETTWPPGGVFPMASSLSLGGQTSRALVVAILKSVNLAQMTCIKFDNLQQFSDLLTPSKQNLHQYSSVTNWNYLCPRKEVNMGVGLMSSHLACICRIMPSLTHLTITTWAPCHMSPQLDGRTNAHIVAAYRRWALLLQSVDQNLQKLTFEQGFSPGNMSLERECKEMHTQFRNVYLEVCDSGRAMDSLFEKHILPAILNQPWPRLRELNVQGFGCWFIYKDEETLKAPCRLRHAGWIEDIWDEHSSEPGQTVRRTSRYDKLRDEVLRHLGPGVKVSMDKPARPYDFANDFYGR